MRFRIILGMAALLATTGLAAAQGRTAIGRSAAPAPAAPAAPAAPGTAGPMPSPVGRAVGVPPLGTNRIPPAGLVSPGVPDGWHPGMLPRSSMSYPSVLYPSLYPSVAGVIPRGSMVMPSIYPGTTGVPRGSVLTPSIYPGRTAVPRGAVPGGVMPNASGDLAPAAPDLPGPQESPRSKIIEVPRQPPASVAPTAEAISPGRTAVPRPSSPLTIVGPGTGAQRRPPVAGGNLQAVPRPSVGGRPSRPQVTPPIAGNDWRSRDHRNHPRFTYRPGISVYPRYYYPRYAYPYGYGAYGLGYFYYDPYQWYGSQQLYWLGPGYYGHGTFVDVGELRLRITPGEAQVYVEGVYVGMAADFEQVLRALKLEIGTYHVDVVLPGYQTLSFDVQITPGRTVTYEGTLLPEPQ